MDYLARAMRVEEIPKLKQQYEEHLVQDKKFWEDQEEERVSDITYSDCSTLSDAPEKIGLKFSISSFLIPVNLLFP